LGAFNVSSVSHKHGFFQLRVLLLGTRNQVVLARAIRLGHLQWAEREERPPSRLASGELVAPAGGSNTLPFVGSCFSWSFGLGTGTPTASTLLVTQSH
jgi:hypothetical protein